MFDRRGGILKRIVVLTIAVGILIGFSYVGYRYLSSEKPASLADQLQTVSVQRGKIEATINALGSLAPAKEKWLSFEAGGPLQELHVAEGQQVKAGQTLAKLDSTSLERSVKQARAELESAQIRLEQAKHPYTQLDLEMAEGAARDATVALENAKKNLTVVQDNPTTNEEIRNLEYEANWYEVNYGKTLKKFEEGKIDQEKLNLEYSNMLTAQEKLRVARERAEIAISEAQNQVAQAEDNLKKAQEELATIKGGADPDEVKLAENQVEIAQVSLERALEDLEGATLAAPFDGTIASIKASPGEMIVAGDKLIHIVDLSSLQIEVSVDEYDIGKIRVEQEALIIPDAFPDRKLSGNVTNVSVVPATSEGMASYPVTISVPDPDPIVRPGMGAEVNIVVAKKENVLLVPNSAIKESDEGKMVYVLSENQIASVPVALGISNGEVTEVVKGLKEGDQAITSSEEVIESLREQYLKPGGERDGGFWQTLKRVLMGLLGLGGE